MLMSRCVVLFQEVLGRSVCPIIYTQFWNGRNVELVMETCFWMVEYHLYSVALLLPSPFVLYLDMFSCAQFSGCVSVIMILR